MNLQEKLSAIQAETAAANARAAASKRCTLELKIQSLKLELELRKLLETPNFPEETKQRILAQLRELKGNGWCYISGCESIVYIQYLTVEIWLSR